MNQLLFLAQNEFDAYNYESSLSASEANALGAGFLVLSFVVFFLFAVPAIIGLWKIFEKAGKPGWAAIVPIYNLIVMLEIVGRPMWWIALLLASFVPLIGPLVAFVAGIIISIDLAKSFGKDAAYGVLIAFLPFIGYPMLGFGDAQYQGPAAAEGAGSIGGAAPMQTNQGVPQPPSEQPEQPVQPPADDNQQQ